jgi:hypothetical protein
MTVQMEQVWKKAAVARPMYCYSMSSEREEHNDFLNNIASNPPEIRSLILLNRSLELYCCTEYFSVLMLKKLVYVVIHNHYAVERAVSSSFIWRENLE